MKKPLSRVALGLVFASSPLLLAQDITLRLDFGATDSPVTSGYTVVTAHLLALTETASVTNIDGLGYDFSFNNVAVYNSGNATEPLITDGFYTFGNNSLVHTFTLGGLDAGDQVSLYALAAWDGNGRGAQVSFGGSTVQAQTIGTPGASPSLANFTFIGSATVTGSGLLTGEMFGAGYPGDPASEGQVGGFIFVITPTQVPEPASAGLLLGLAASGFALARRRRRAA